MHARAEAFGPPLPNKMRSSSGPAYQTLKTTIFSSFLKNPGGQPEGVGCESAETVALKVGTSTETQP